MEGGHGDKDPPSARVVVTLSGLEGEELVELLLDCSGIVFKEVSALGLDFALRGILFALELALLLQREEGRRRGHIVKKKKEWWCRYFTLN